MKTQRVLVAVLVLAFMLALSAGLIQASGPAQNPAPWGRLLLTRGNSSRVATRSTAPATCSSVCGMR